MKMTHTLTGIAALMALTFTTAAQGATVVYQSDFTGTTLASAGLTQKTFDVSSNYILNETDDRVEVSYAQSNDRGSLYTTNAWQSTDGFTLDASFNHIADGTRFSFGIVDSTWTVSGSRDWLNEGRAGAYGIGLSTDGEFAGSLAFNNGSSTSSLSTAQGNVTLNQLSTLSMTITGTGWSYSLNGQSATEDSFTFDTSKSYRFIAYTQDAAMNGTYFSNITLTAIPEPGTYALLGGLLALSYVMVRRR